MRTTRPLPPQVARALRAWSRVPLPGAPAPPLPPVSRADWPLLVEAAAAHRTVGRVRANLDSPRAAALRGAAETCPAPAVALRLRALDLDAQRLARRALDAAAEVLDACAAAGEPVAVLKGVALVAALLDEPALHPMTDADLLVRPGRLDTLAPRLERLGYTLGRRYAHVAVWQRGAAPDATIVDLHDHASDPHRAALDPARAWARAVPVRLAGRDTLRLALPDQLCAAALHHVGEHGLRVPLLWFAELAETAAAWGGELDAEALRDEARRAGAARPLWLLAGHVQAHYPGALPAPLLRAPDRGARLAARCLPPAPLGAVRPDTRRATAVEKLAAFDGPVRWLRYVAGSAADRRGMARRTDPLNTARATAPGGAGADPGNTP